MSRVWQMLRELQNNNNLTMMWTLLEIMRVSEVDLAAGVPAAHEAAVVLEDGAGAPGVQQLTLLALVQVQADHLVLDAPHQQLGGPLGIPAEHCCLYDTIVISLILMKET